ncbi:hypothetical protein KR074_000853 [Drosophila pseudoananassae]|nr:hypothetical protein KR074_000853 [Drosophila pseudoananassae]
MRWGVALLVLVALVVVATEAQKTKRTSKARVLANATPRKMRTIKANRQVKGRTRNTKKRSLKNRRSSGTSRRRSAVIIGSGSTTSSSSSTPAARCVTTTCNANTNVCGRWASTRRCHRFRNNCQLERTNCNASGSSWNRVNIGNCSSISVNSSGTCTSTFSSSSSSSGSGWSNILSSILGTSSTSSSSNVVPIIIRRG